MIRQVRCNRCGTMTRRDDVHTCSPLAPVPPHAAGEEVDRRAEFTNALGEYLNAWTGYKEHPCEHCSQRVNIAHDRLWRMVSPAASQAAPEMPESVAETISHARQLEADGDSTQSGQSVIWLADRVAALERELAQALADRSECIRQISRGQ